MKRYCVTTAASISVVVEMYKMRVQESGKLVEALRDLIERMKWHHNGSDTCEDAQCEGCLAVRVAEAALETQEPAPKEKTC